MTVRGTAGTPRTVARSAMDRCYRGAMAPAASAATPRRLGRVLGWRRVLVASAVATVIGLIINPAFETTPTLAVIGREMVVGLGALLAFGLFETWPARLPRWLARWALQVIGVAFAVPISVMVLYSVITHGDPVPFWHDQKRMMGFSIMMMTNLLVAPWTAVAALFRQRDDAARAAALAFELERSELERQALDARLRVLQAQVEPHFLFNTLANVRELVDGGSPQASTVLGHLIAYLRAAVPQLHEPATTLGNEVQLVRSYLEVMHMRMPDRLQYTLEVDEAALALRCPPMTLLTLVENAVRHGIDPSEDGGRIEVRAQLRDGRCRAQVRDTGVGLVASRRGLGTGLATLRERLQLVFGGDARLELAALEPHGACAELDFPAQRSPA
jgi:hypothetical protein